QPRQSHGTGEWVVRARRPAGPTVCGRDEPDLELTGRAAVGTGSGRATCLRVVVIGDADVRRVAAPGDGDAGNEVVHRTVRAVDRHARDRRPSHAVARRAHHDIVLLAALAKAAILPDEVDPPGAV